MGGAGFRGSTDAEYLRYDEGVDVVDQAADAKFITGTVGEVSALEWASLHSMRRRGPDEPWETVNETTVWAFEDEGNNPEHTARARIIAVEDSDGDRAPEVVSLVIQDRHDWEDDGMRDDICPDVPSHHHCNGFELDILAREDDQMASDRVILRLDGEHALTEKVEQPDDVGDEAHATLRAQLDEHREAAVIKARAILREAGKLR
jgi:hypothetical protein